MPSENKVKLDVLKSFKTCFKQSKDGKQSETVILEYPKGIKVEKEKKKE